MFGLRDILNHYVSVNINKDSTVHHDLENLRPETTGGRFSPLTLARIASVKCMSVLRVVKGNERMLGSHIVGQNFSLVNFDLFHHSNGSYHAKYFKF